MGSVSLLIFTELQPEMRGLVLFAAIFQLSQGAPQFLGYPYALHYAVPSAAVVTGNAVPVSVGGYKAVAGSNGDLAGPVHEVPGLVPALATHKQESSGGVSLSTGTGALVHTLAHGVYYGKREANPAPAVLYSSVGYSHPAYSTYAAHYPYTYGAYPYTHGGYHYY